MIMQCARVERLAYRVVWQRPDWRVSQTAPPLTGTLGDFDLVLNPGLLDAIPRPDFRSIDGARAALEPLLFDWEMEWDIRHNLRVSFKFASGQTRNFVTDELGLTTSVHADAGMSLEFGQFPAFPSRELRNTRFGNRLRSRLHNLDDEKETVCACAYYILTAVERKFGSRRKAAGELGFSKQVLENLGRLAAVHDPTHGRKAKNPETELDPREIGWMKTALKQIVTRAVEVESGITISGEITMKNFPKLP